MGNETRYIEELFMRANAEIDAHKYTEAKAILEEILEIEPTYGRAYNHLAWIYAEILKINDKAVPLYKLAMKYAPTYGAPYINYLYVLLDQYDVSEMEKVIAKARTVAETDKGMLDFLQARAYELRSDYKNAYRYYNSAKKRSFNEKFMNDMSAQMNRLLSKLNRVNRAWANLFW